MRRHLMTLLGAGLLLAGTATAQCNEWEGCPWEARGYSYSGISIDPGTGAILAHGFTGFLSWGSYWSFTASVSTGISSGGWGYESDNCGSGCAYVEVGSQVNQLGQTYTEFSAHDAQAYSDIDFPYWYTNGTSQDYNVPPAPQISLQQIDATDPSWVRFSYSVDGTPLHSANLELWSDTQDQGYARYYVDIATSSPPNFYINQNNLMPTGAETTLYSGPPNVYLNQNTSRARVYGFLYGMVVEAGSCEIQRRDGGMSDLAGGVRSLGLEFEPEPGIPAPIPNYRPIIPPMRFWAFGQAILIKHWVRESITTISYCIAPVEGSRTTAVYNAMATIDTIENSGDIPDLMVVNELIDHYPAWSWAVMGPPGPGMGPHQGERFRTREINADPASWIPPNTQSAICNDFAWFQDDATGSILFPWPSIGCVNWNVP